MAACGRENPLLESPLRGDLYQTLNHYADFFDADFGRRPWVASSLIHFGGERSLPFVVPPPVIGDDVRVLPDGRVAVVVASGRAAAPDSVVYVFTDRDGAWLVDEFLLIDSAIRPVARNPVACCGASRSWGAGVGPV